MANHRGDCVDIDQSALKISNARPCSNDERNWRYHAGKVQYRQPVSRKWEDYIADLPLASPARKHRIPNDLDLDVYQVLDTGQVRLADSLSYSRRLEKWTVESLKDGVAKALDLPSGLPLAHRFEVQPGRYVVVAKTYLQKEDSVVVKLRSSNVPGELVDADGTRFRLGGIGKSATGLFEIVRVEPDTLTIQDSDGWQEARITRRFHYVWAEQCHTMVEESGTGRKAKDVALLVLCSDSDIGGRGVARQAWFQNTSLSDMNKAAPVPNAMKGTAVEVDVIFDSVSHGLAVEGWSLTPLAGAILSSSVGTDRAFLSPSWLAGVGESYLIGRIAHLDPAKFGFPTKFSHPSISLFTIAMVRMAENLRAHMRSNRLRAHAHSDDLYVRGATFRERDRRFAVTVENLGQPVYNLRLRLRSGKLTRDTSERDIMTTGLDTDALGEVACFLPSGVGPDPDRFVLAYEMRPFPGYHFTFTMPLGELQVEHVPCFPRESASPVRVAVEIVPGPNTSSGATVQLVATVQNMMSDPVRLGIRDARGDGFDLRDVHMEKRVFPERRQPHVLGVEACYGQNPRWGLALTGFRWVPMGYDGPPMAVPGELEIPAGQVRKVGLLMPAERGKLEARAIRVFVKDPCCRRIDECVRYAEDTGGS